MVRRSRQSTHTNGEEVHQRAVNLSGLEHPLRTNSAPYERSVVHDLGAVAGEPGLVGRLAEVGDVAYHPAQYTRLRGGGEDRGVDLSDEERPRRDFLRTRYSVIARAAPGP